MLTHGYVAAGQALFWFSLGNSHQQNVLIILVIHQRHHRVKVPQLMLIHLVMVFMLLEIILSEHLSHILVELFVNRVDYSNDTATASSQREFEWKTHIHMVIKVSPQHKMVYPTNMA